MKPFGLETVLHYRKRKEDIAISRLFEAKEQRKQLENKKNNRQAQYTHFVAQLIKTQETGAEIEELIRLEENISFTKTKIEELQVLLDNKDEQLKRLQQKLLECSRDRKAMEKLKEKQNANWQKYLNKKEAAMLDEIAVIHHNK